MRDHVERKRKRVNTTETVESTRAKDAPLIGRSSDQNRCCVRILCMQAYGYTQIRLTFFDQLDITAIIPDLCSVGNGRAYFSTRRFLSKRTAYGVVRTRKL